MKFMQEFIQTFIQSASSKNLSERWSECIRENVRTCRKHKSYMLNQMMQRDHSLGLMSLTSLRLGYPVVKSEHHKAARGLCKLQMQVVKSFTRWLHTTRWFYAQVGFIVLRFRFGESTFALSLGRSKDVRPAR